MDISFSKLTKFRTLFSLYTSRLSIHRCPPQTDSGARATRAIKSRDKIFHDRGLYCRGKNLSVVSAGRSWGIFTGGWALVAATGRFSIGLAADL
jgi:hypothetical protein